MFRLHAFAPYLQSFFFYFIVHMISVYVLHMHKCFYKRMCWLQVHTLITNVIRI